MKTYEPRFDDEYTPTIDFETREEVEISKSTVRESMLDLLRWAEKRRGKKFLVPGKQFKAMKILRKANRGPDEMRRKWLEMEEDKFWKDKDFDFMTIISELDKERQK